MSTNAGETPIFLIFIFCRKPIEIGGFYPDLVKSLIFKRI
jgi:hypothetical protein